MLHGFLQFTLRIAFRCVLHRYESQDIPLYRVVFGWIQWLGRLHINFRLVLFGVNVNKDQLENSFRRKKPPSPL